MTSLSSSRSTAPIAIDAPTVVPSENRMRDCERTLHLDEAIRKAHAAPYPGTRALLGKCNGGQPRGEELVQRLKADLGVSEVGCPPPGHSTRYAMEVFPAAAMVRLFGLTGPLVYKMKRRTPLRRAHGCVIRNAVRAQRRDCRNAGENADLLWIRMSALRCADAMAKTLMRAMSGVCRALLYQPAPAPLEGARTLF